MENTNPNPEPDALIEAARRGAWAEAEARWMERLEAKPPAAAPFLEAARRLAEAGEKDRLSILVAMTAPPLLAAGEAAAVLELLRSAAAVRSEEADLAEHALQAARRVYGKYKEFDSLLARADLERGEGLRHLMGLLDAYFRFDVGDLALHSGGWGTGEVKKIVPRREELHVQFESGRSHVFPLRSAGDYLTRIPSDRLDAMLRKDRELLREEAEKDPLRLLSRALAFKGGPLEGKELKAMLVPAVVDEARWSDWWGGVRFKARKSPAFEIAGGPNPLITPRSASIAPGNDLRAQFRIEGAFWDRVRLVRHHVKDSGPAEVDAAFVVEALDALGRSAASVPEKLALAFLREDARKAAAGAAPSPPAEFPGPGDLAAVLRAVPVAEYKNRILEEARRRLPDEWPQVFAGLLFNDDPESWESAVQALVKAGRAELFAARVPAILSAPGRNPWAFLWLAKNALQGHLGGIPAVPGPTAFVDLLLGVVHDARTDRLCEGAEAKKVAAKARGLLTAETLRKAFEGVTEAEAKRLWHRVRTCGLSATVLQRAENVVADLYPDLIGESSAAEEEKKKDDILWTTLAGLNRRRRDYDQLMNEEFPKNAADLGEAISKGDLSENAEYTAAREKQRELIERASRMEEELRKAHVFDTAAVSADVAGIGTQIEVAEEGKQVRSFTLLGPWDTDIDRGLISYLSPIGQALLGRKVGEKVQVQAPEGIRVMEVRSIRRAPQIEAPHTADPAAPPSA